MSSFHSRLDDELGFGEDDDGLVEIVNKRLDVINWVKAREDVPTIISLPTIGKRVNIIHSVFEDDNIIAGINGFQHVSPLLLIEADQFGHPMRSTASSGATKNLALPTAHQIMELSGSGARDGPV